MENSSEISTLTPTDKNGTRLIFCLQPSVVRQGLFTTAVTHKRAIEALSKDRRKSFFFYRFYIQTAAKTMVTS